MSSTAIAQASEAAPRNTNKIMGERVHQVMWRGQVTQTAFAPVLGMTQSALSSKLRGRRAFTSDEILKVADTFGVSLDYLFGKTDDPRPVGPDGDRVEVGPVDPRRFELLTSCLQTERFAEVIPLHIHRAA